MNALQAIKAAMRQIGVLATGEAPTGAESQDALATLNRMLDGWSTENLLIPYQTKESFSLTALQRTYTYGTGGDFNSARPIKIMQAFFRDAGGTDYPITLIPTNQWVQTPYKASATRPRNMHYEPEYPLGKIYFETVPEADDNLHVFALKPLTTLTELTTDFSLPPGYERMIILNLAVELNPEYGGNLKQETMMLAERTKRTMKSQNNRLGELRVDSGLIKKGQSYDWNAGPT